MVATAQLGGIDFHFIGGDVDQSLNHVGGFRPTRAAIRRCAMGVGQHAGNFHIERGRCISADHRADIDHRRHGAAKRNEGA
jgi:hypothetical protein